MSRDEILLDLYDRLTSRKLWLCLLSIAFAWWNFAEARLSAVEFQAAVFGAIGVYTVSEGITDAAGAWRSTPETTVETTVNTDADVAPAATTTTTPAKRVRPSRAKPRKETA